MTQQRPQHESAVSNVDIEAPESDVAEQQPTAEPHTEGSDHPVRSIEVDWADAAEQEREVELDEDEYR